jgi:hypothetical protein
MVLAFTPQSIFGGSWKRYQSGSNVLFIFSAHHGAGHDAGFAFLEDRPPVRKKNQVNAWSRSERYRGSTVAPNSSSAIGSYGVAFLLGGRHEMETNGLRTDQVLFLLTSPPAIPGDHLRRASPSARNSIRSDGDFLLVGLSTILLRGHRLDLSIRRQAWLKASSARNSQRLRRFSSFVDAMGGWTRCAVLPLLLGAATARYTKGRPDVGPRRRRFPSWRSALDLDRWLVRLQRDEGADAGQDFGRSR